MLEYNVEKELGRGIKMLDMTRKKYYTIYAICIMKIRVSEYTVKAVEKEIKGIKNRDLIVLLHNRLDYINGEQLETMLQTNLFDKIRSEKSDLGLIYVYELRVSRGKGSDRNLRALLCGVEGGGKGSSEIELYVMKVWGKDTQKVPNKYIDLAIKRFKELMKSQHGGGEQ